MKRFVDLVACVIALVTLSPFLLLVAFAVVVTSGRPVLFRHERVGRDGRPFEVLKFRTMRPRDESDRSEVTAAGNERITTVGKWLRRYKVDELPQLWNVVRGEMSLVGPRPEVAQYVRCYPDDFAFIHSVRPGITDPASLAFRHEEQLLADSQDPEHTYVSEILPQKLELSRQYVHSASLRQDLGLLFKTARSIAGG